jgi:protein-tyrosine phosphatase
MIDIHHHLLFDTDDGPKDLEGSVAQAEAAAANGITHIVCTPHANSTWKFEPEQNRAKLDMIRECVGDRVTLGLGCDFHLSYDNIQEALEKPAKFTINGGRYLLVEFADSVIPESIGETFYEFSLRGIRPIITHPERNPILQREPDRLADWLRGNCVVQITAGSLEGRFGRRAQEIAWDLLAKKWVHFIATDAHNLEKRPPYLRAVYEAIGKKFDAGTADRLCVENPRAVFENREMPEQAAPEGISVDQDRRALRGLTSRPIDN